MEDNTKSQGSPCHFPTCCKWSSCTRVHDNAIKH